MLDSSPALTCSGLIGSKTFSLEGTVPRVSAAHAHRASKGCAPMLACTMTATATRRSPGAAWTERAATARTQPESHRLTQTVSTDAPATRKHRAVARGSAPCFSCAYLAACRFSKSVRIEPQRDSQVRSDFENLQTQPAGWTCGDAARAVAISTSSASRRCRRGAVMA